MKRLEIPVKGGLVGHVLSVPQETEGLVWAVNVFPDGPGVRMWRPRLSYEEGYEGYAQIFNPDEEEFLYAECVHDGVMTVLRRKDGSGVQLVWWQPGKAPVRLPWTFPEPKDGKTAMCRPLGPDGILAVDGYGLWVLEWNEEEQKFGRAYRVGAPYVGFSYGKKFEFGPGEHVLLALQFEWPHYIYMIRLFMKGIEDSPAKVKLKVIHSGGQEKESVEEIDTQTLVQDGEVVSPIWMPIEFTIDEVVDGHCQIVLVVDGGSVKVEQGSREDIPWGVQKVGGAKWHMHVSGTMCPNGGVVCTTRGGVAAVRDDCFVEVADAGSLMFEQEFSVPDRVLYLAHVKGNLVVVGMSSTYAASDWSYGAVNVEKVWDFGIRRITEAREIAGGLLMWSAGRPVAIGLGVPEGMPFLTEPPHSRESDAYITFLPRWGCLLVMWKGSKYALVYSIAGKWTVWWRFDEADGAMVVGGCRDVVVLDNGKAHYITYSDDEGWPSYQCEVAVSVGLVGPEPEFQAQKALVYGSLVVPVEGHARLYVLGHHKRGIDYALVKLPATDPFLFSSDDERVPPVVDRDGSLEGLYWPVPLDEEVGDGVFLVPALSMPTVQALDGWVEGSSFLVQLVVGKGCPKHVGSLVRSVVLFGEFVGGGL